MANKEIALACWAIMSDELAPIAARLDAWQTFEDLRKIMKVGAAKLVAEDQAAVEGLLESLRALRDEPKDAEAAKILEGIDPVIADAETEADPLEEEAPKPAKAKADTDRGLITARVKLLLQETEWSYSEIEADVKTMFPNAKTTTRSIASTASEMRKAGVDVAQRRAPKGETPT